MSFTEFFIRRPAFTIVISLVMTIVGLISYYHLPVRWVPQVNLPVVGIHTSYPGASAALVESQITTPLEAAISGIPGIEAFYSSSRQNGNYINIELKLGSNIDVAVENIRNALQEVQSSFPQDVKVTIQKADPNGSPIMYIAFSDAQRTAQQVSDYVKQFILPRLQTIEGVAYVSTYGERQPALHLWLDPMKMTAFNITPGDIMGVLAEQNVQIPSGKIRGAERFYNIVMNQKMKSADEFNELILRANQNQVVRVKDIGQAVIDAENTDSAFRVNGQAAIALAIVPQSTTNPLDVAKHITQEFKQFSPTLPQGLEGKIVFNQATFIQASIDHVYESIFEAIILVTIVIFLFLASMRAALIPIITIPVCLISTFAVMSVLGISINTITLMAFVLAIGLVVDDAIVMLENISRYIELGMKPFAAAIKGSREIVFPIIAMTITLAAVYAPIAFTPGILGTVFWEFAITLVSAVFISGIVALTLSPMMSARLLTRHSQEGKYAQWSQKRLGKLQNFYASLLARVLQKKVLVIFFLIAIAISGIFIYRSLPSELTPSEDMNEIDSFVMAQRDASFEYTDSYVRQLEAIYKKIPEIETYGSEVGFGAPSRATQFLILKPTDQRSRGVNEIVNQLNQEAKAISGVQIAISPTMSPLASFSGSEGASISMRIMSSVDYKTLHAIMKRFIEEAQKYPGFLNVMSMLKWDGSQLEVTIDRDKAAVMNVSMREITNTISTLLAGQQAGHFEYDGNLYNIIVQMQRSSLMNHNIISELYVRNNEGQMIPLSGLVTMREITSPEALPHYDRLRADALRAMLAPGYSVADAVNVLQQIAKEVLPENAKYTFEGEAKTYLDSSSTMNFTFILALIFIYLVLVAQFESFVDPLIILLTVPFALIGALLTLKITGGSLNIYSNIALVTLIGLIAKHGILITQFAEYYRQQGKPLAWSVIEAAKLRLRPILITTAAMVLGALPLAFAAGPGAEIRQQIGWVIVGGLLIGTFFSLFVVPVAYIYLARWKKSYAVEDTLEKIQEEA